MIDRVCELNGTYYRIHAEDLFWYEIQSLDHGEVIRVEKDRVEFPTITGKVPDNRISEVLVERGTGEVILYKTFAGIPMCDCSQDGRFIIASNGETSIIDKMEAIGNHLVISHSHRVDLEIL